MCKRSLGSHHWSVSFACTVEKPIEITTKWKRLLIPTQIAPHFISAFQNGDLLKWWQIFGDGRDISITSLCNNYGVRL